MLLLCGFAQAQGDYGAARLVRAEAVLRLQHADPIVRGEAALVVAAGADASSQATIVAMTTDPEPPARLRAIVALGLLAIPASAAAFDQLLADPQSRVEPEGVAAAFALGIMPPDRAASITSRVLASFLHASWKRQREVVLALLLGMAQNDQSGQAASLRRLFDDESNRDPEVRAELLLLLLPVDRTFDGKLMRRLLERGSDEERATLLQWLATNHSAFDTEVLPNLERIAGNGLVPEQRATALAALTRMHHVPALALAARALASSHPAENAQGMRSMLSLGGATMRVALERHLREEPDPARKAALLANYDAPLSTDLADLCARLAADALQPLALRTAAATTLARSAPTRAIPLLRDLFRSTPHRSSLGSLAAALLRAEPEPPPLERLLDGPPDLRQHPERWEALLGAGHPEATRVVLLSLESSRSSVEHMAMALGVWRRCMVLGLPRSPCAATPAVLRKVLGG